MKAIQLSTVRRSILAISVLILGSACTCPLLTRSSDTELTPDTKATTVATATAALTPTSLPTPTPTADTLIVRSFPSGREVYVVPEEAAQRAGPVDLTAEDYFVGRTPIEVSVEPGTYYVIVEHEPATHLIDDGIDDTIFTMHEGEEGNWLLTGKIYEITKRTGYQAIVTALIWPERQSTEEFIATLPDEELFEVTLESLEPVLRKHHIPTRDWDLVLSMLRKTGKAIWQGENPADYLIIYFVEPDRMEARWGGTATP
ncbi:MAG: hypothetical protein AB8I69_06900 [Anaerolineae bacterium]|jgi:hypothetical protein